MILKLKSGGFLVSTEASAALDAEARDGWGFDIHALIESAGQGCARAFSEVFKYYFKTKNFSGRRKADSHGNSLRTRPRVTVVIGGGNNGADAMVMLRYLILSSLVEPSLCSLVAAKMPKAGDTSPWVELIKSLRKMNVRFLVWDGDIGEAAGRASDDVLAHSDIIIDGISGTGLSGSLRGAALDMVNAINSHKERGHDILAKKKQLNKQFKSSHPFVISVDIPSGLSDTWEPGMPAIKADYTLAIEPQKCCIYALAARPFAGIIISINGIFPREMIRRHAKAEILDWENARLRVSRIHPNVYKNQRGTVELWAGSIGATGAALIAARGAQAAGAGLVRLYADDEIYHILAAQVSGVMVIPASKKAEASRADALLLGSGWGKDNERIKTLDYALELEKKGVPLVLDADAIELVKEKTFNGRAILTPHVGEFSRYSGIEGDELYCRPIPVLQQYAREKKAVIVFKGHVITIAAPDGRIGIVDGMTPGLAAGGSGDLLAGFCAAIAARMISENRGFDAYTCAAAAVTLLIASGRSKDLSTRFTDPLEVADKAADLAGQAWLCPVPNEKAEEYSDER